MSGDTTFLAAIFLSFLAAIIPTMVWATLVWWCDRYEREPLALLVASFLWGAFPAITIAVTLESWWGLPEAKFGESIADTIVSSGIAAPIIEELAKAVCLLMILLFWRGEFDDVLDGILYGAMVGFGFAMTENFIYFIGAFSEAGWSGWGATVLLRAVIFGLNHAFYTALTGAALSYARSRRRKWQRLGFAVVGLLIAIGTHAIHNLGAALAAHNPAAILLSVISDGGGIVLVGVMIWLALKQEQRWLREELAHYVGGLLTDMDYAVLTSQRQRWKSSFAVWQSGGWPALRSQLRFNQCASELAFQRHSARVREDDTKRAHTLIQLELQLAQLVAERVV